MLTVKNTDRASRPAVLSDGRQIDPGKIDDAPDDATTGDLIAIGWLTPVEGEYAAGMTDDPMPDGPIKAIEQWVGTDKDKARSALQAEQKRHDGVRKTLVDHLTQIAEES